MSGGYGDVAYVMLCNTLVLWGCSIINPGGLSGGTSNSTILPQGYRTGPGHDLAGIALLPAIISVSVSIKKMGEGGIGGAGVKGARGKRRGFSPSLCAPQESDQSFYVSLFLR